MENTKKFSDEMLKKYVSSEISIIKDRRNKRDEWKKNNEFHSQITIRMEGDNNGVSTIPDGKV